MKVTLAFAHTYATTKVTLAFLLLLVLAVIVGGCFLQPGTTVDFHARLFKFRIQRDLVTPPTPPDSLPPPRREENRYQFHP